MSGSPELREALEILARHPATPKAEPGWTEVQVRDDGNAQILELETRGGNSITVRMFRRSLTEPWSPPVLIWSRGGVSTQSDALIFARMVHRAIAIAETWAARTGQDWEG